MPLFVDGTAIIMTICFSRKFMLLKPFCRKQEFSEKGQLLRDLFYRRDDMEKPIQGSLGVASSFQLTVLPGTGRCPETARTPGFPGKLRSFRN